MGAERRWKVFPCPFYEIIVLELYKSVIGLVVCMYVIVEYGTRLATYRSGRRSPSSMISWMRLRYWYSSCNFGDAIIPVSSYSFYVRQIDQLKE